MQDDPLQRLGAEKKIFSKRHQHSDPKPLAKRHCNHDITSVDDHPRHFQNQHGHDELFYLRDASLQDKIKSWRKNALTSHLRCDLHSLTVDQAYQRMNKALQQAQEQKYRTILFIHGKALHSDRAAIKSMLAGELKHKPDVLSYWSAPPSHGGSGALFCLIKNKKENHV